MSTITNVDTKDRKRTLLKFLLGKPHEQPKLFRQIINDELLKRKAFYDNINESDLQINKTIINSKLKEIDVQTKILKEQILAQTKNEKHNSIVSIIERKLYIVELQIDIGVNNLLKQPIL